jgi:hypothetical protein
LPAETTSSFQPTSVPAGFPSSSTTLQIVTTAHTSSAAPGFRFPVVMNPFRLVWIASFALIALLLLAQKKKRIGRLRLQLCAATALLVLCGALITACGGGGHGSTINTASGTPAGTYPITVTITSGGVTRSTTVTLIVQ